MVREAGAPARPIEDETPLVEAPLVEAAPGPSAQLRFAAALLEAHVRAAVESRRAVDPNPDDAFRGLYTADEDVERLLAGGWPAIARLPEPLATERQRLHEDLADPRQAGTLGELVRRFSLSALDAEILVAALAPDIDSRFERLYGYLNDDVTRRRATIGLALELCDEPSTSPLGRGRLSPGAPLVAGGLVVIEDLDRAFLNRSLRVPDRVIAHLLGDREPDAELGSVLSELPPAIAIDPSTLARAIGTGAGLVYLREQPGSAGRSLAVAALARLGLGAVSIDLNRLEPDADVGVLADTAGREARLQGAGLIAGPLEALSSENRARERAQVRAFAELECDVVVLLGRSAWDPSWSTRVPLSTASPLPEGVHRLESWAASLSGSELAPEELADSLSAFRLGPEQMARASEAARWQAAIDDAPITVSHVRAGALAQNAAGLERLARRIEPRVAFTDLVLPGLTVRLLRELVGRVHHRDRVLGDWSMRPGGGRGRGVTALFAGESGTGKTMSAEVVAGALGLELYTINLATVVDKYVGETEKNLERIFSEVDGVNGVLLFDEADALFGKRSEVKDAHDRYANIEVAYLLQRIETFDGLAILATNLRANVDEAFTRRLDAVIDFPFPDVAQRLELWRQCLPRAVPLAEDVDLEFLASSFELSGGNIRSIALTSAYLAADEQHDLSMADFIRAVHREYRKLGRLSVRSEFGKWYDVVAAEADT